MIQLGVQFGRVSNVLVLKGKNQAFLEMADENSAAAMVACLSANPPQVRGRTVYVQFSNHRELKTDQNHSIAVSGNFLVQGILLYSRPSVPPHRIRTSRTNRRPVDPRYPYRAFRIQPHPRELPRTTAGGTRCSGSSWSRSSIRCPWTFCTRFSSVSEKSSRSSRSPKTIHSR